MKPNKPTINLVKEFEGLELEAYYDPVGIGQRRYDVEYRRIGIVGLR